MNLTVNVNGQKIGRDEYLRIVNKLHDLAKEIAGVFYDQDRSEKFRVNWPLADDFVEANYRSFIAAARAMYAQALGSGRWPPKYEGDVGQKLTEAEKRDCHLAIVLQHMAEEGLKQHGRPTDTRLQLTPGTQQFEGDPVENKRIVQNFGRRANLRAHFLSGAAKFAKNLH